MAVPTWIRELRFLSAPFIAIGTIVIGHRTLQIARQQALTAGQKLRLELFERRFSIYKTVADAMVNASAFDTTAVFDESTTHLMVKLEEARFLFDKQIFEYLDRIWKEILNCRHWRVVINQRNMTISPDYPSYVDKHEKSQSWLLQHRELLPSQLKSALQIDDQLSFSSAGLSPTADIPQL